MSSFDLGTLESGKALRCDLARLIDTRLLVQANSGGGKSWAIRRLLEQTHGHVQHLVIDPEGEFSSLRERFDYVLAARHGGDTAAEPRAAKLLAERLLELGASAILDIYELKAHERVKFVRLFLEALVDAPKKLWHPAVVVIDEAHVFCPQVGEAESAGAVIDLATRGRKRGFCALLATQRLSKLHKDAAAECNNKLIGRTGLDVDVKRAADELGLTGREEQQRLRALEPGNFFAFGPALSATVQRVEVGDVRTTHPKAGARLASVTPPPTARIRALLPKLADLPAEAERKVATEAELRKQMGELQRQLAAKPAPAAPKVERVEVPVLAGKDLARFESAVAHLQGAAERVQETGKAVLEAFARSQGRAQAIRGNTRKSHEIPRSVRVVPPAQVAMAQCASRDSFRQISGKSPANTTPGLTRDGDAISGPEQRILNALAWLETIGVAEPEQPAAAFLAGYTIGGGAWNNPKGRLRGRGLLEYRPGDRLSLTDAGRALAQAPDAPLTAEELQRMVLERLPGPERRLLTVLIKHYPTPIPNEQLAGEAGYEIGGGAFNNPRGRLRSLGLIDYPDRGQAVALPLLFLEGGGR